MKPKLFQYCAFGVILLASALTSCSDIIEPSITKGQVIPEAPYDQYASSNYTVNFWWDKVDNALTYHLQVVTPTFSAPAKLALDTIINNNKFAYNFDPGNYQWRVMAENGSTQTAYSPVRNFSVAASSIKQQSVQLLTPANNYITNQPSQSFQWSTLFGATQYQLEIDTNNFVNENSLVYNQLVPGQQLNFTFQKDGNYQWRVRARNDTAQALWSPVYQLTYDHTPPAQVTLTLPADNSTVALPVTLQWSTVTGAVGYRLYIYQSDSTTLLDQTYPKTVNSTSSAFTSGNSTNKFYWTVTAVDAAGNESQPAKLRSFTLQ